MRSLQLQHPRIPLLLHRYTYPARHRLQEHFAIKDNEAYEPTYKGDRHSHTALADSHVRPSCASQVPTALAVEVCAVHFLVSILLCVEQKQYSVSGQYEGGGV